MLGWPVTLRFGDPLVMDRWRWLNPRLRSGPLRTFDAGCGNGCFSFAAAARGNQVVAGSYDTHSIEKACERAELFGLDTIEFLTIDLCDLDRRSDELGTFDQIICTECIEHIHDDGKLVQDLSRLLRPGGRLFLTTPELSHRPLRFEENLLTEPGGHVRWGYTSDELQRLFASAGLQVLETSYTSGWISQQLTNLMRVKRERLAWALSFPLRAFQGMDRVSNSIIRRPWFGIAIVGEKSVHQ